MEMRHSPGPAFAWPQHLVHENWMLGLILFQSIDVAMQMDSWQALRNPDHSFPDT